MITEISDGKKCPFSAGLGVRITQDWVSVFSRTECPKSQEYATWYQNGPKRGSTCSETVYSRDRFLQAPKRTFSSKKASQGGSACSETVRRPPGDPFPSTIPVPFINKEKGSTCTEKPWFYDRFIHHLLLPGKHPEKKYFSFWYWRGQHPPYCHDFKHAIPDAD